MLSVYGPTYTQAQEAWIADGRRGVYRGKRVRENPRLWSAGAALREKQICANLVFVNRHERREYG
jgi:hypothetical protein